jgi:type II secretion system protein N
MAERFSWRKILKHLRGRWALAIYVVVGILLFIVFLTASFPYGQTVSSLLAPYHLKLTYNSQSINFPVGARLKNVELISLEGPNDGVVVKSPSVKLAPTIGSLFLGSPGLNINAALYGGSVHASVNRRSRITHVSFSLDQLNLADNLQLINMGAVVNGILSGHGNAEINGPEIVDNSGDAILSAKHFSVQPEPGMLSIRFGSVFGKFTVAQGTIKIQQLQAHGGDAEIEVQGSIQLDADDLADSVVNATMYLNPTPEGRHHLGLLLNFLPHPPSSGPYRLHGPLNSISLD